MLAGVACFQAVNPGPPVGPEEAPSEAWRRLESLNSFRFHIRYGTTGPLALGADMQGIWEAPDREAWDGAWWRGPDRVRTALVGAGDVQYERGSGGWTRSPRGVETRVLEQARQVLRVKRLDYRGETGGVYRYEFQPWLPVLDPARQKTFAGVLRIDRQTGLPLGIRCTEPLGRAEWSLRFGRFDRAGHVRVPFVAEQELVLAVSGRVGRNGLDSMVRGIRARLEGLSRGYRLFRRWGRLVLQVERRLAGDPLGLVLAPGRVELWQAVRVDGDTTPEGQSPTVHEVGGDASVKVRLVRRIAVNPGLQAEIRHELLPEPLLVFTLPDVAGDTAASLSPVALVLDGRVLDITGAVRESSVEFGNLGARERIAILVELANHPPLPAGFNVVSER